MSYTEIRIPFPDFPETMSVTNAVTRIGEFTLTAMNYGDPEVRRMVQVSQIRIDVDPDAEIGDYPILCIDIDRETNHVLIQGYPFLTEEIMNNGYNMITHATKTDLTIRDILEGVWNVKCDEKFVRVWNCEYSSRAEYTAESSRAFLDKPIKDLPLNQIDLS